jgi:hypothetical protein
LQKHLAQAKFAYEIRCLGLLDSGCKFRGITRPVDFCSDTPCDIYFNDNATFHQFGGSQSGSHEPNHKSAQSAAVSAQCGGGSKFDSTPDIRASKDYHSAGEIEHWRQHYREVHVASSPSGQGVLVTFFAEQTDKISPWKRRFALPW